jgi:hypothetical protein
VIQMTHEIEDLLDDDGDDAVTLLFFRKHELEYETSHTEHPVTLLRWDEELGLFDIH